MTGKEKCNLFKEIRIAVADVNHIVFKANDCSSQELCAGTCAQCEKEVAYLNNEIEHMILRGETVYIPNNYYVRMQNVIVPEGGIYTSKSFQSLQNKIEEPLAGDLVEEDEGGWE